MRGTRARATAGRCVVGALTGVLALTGCTAGDGGGEAAGTEDAAGAGPAGGSSSCPVEGEPFEGDLRLFVEHNATDQDSGVHGTVGHDGLVDVCVRLPGGEQLLAVDPAGRLDALGINDFFFESREPPADEYPLEVLREDFPEGEYTISGTDVGGTARVGTARFTHDIPAAPVITAPALAEEENAGEAVLSPSGLVVRWEPVTATLDGEPVTVTGYEVIVTQVEHDDPDGLSRPVFDVHLPPDRTELAVPDGFLRPGTLYELEVLALEESGNQTITLGFFTTSS
ncbi:fibronectin type III domain-containing protein [Geodermatophilus sp. YIM 151500]|uniref:fibronectin type III domain-containing protein n=1 Tax=Geodermatophilus sp. YIM 151500 TaxID=2984531 RepID=UPI0021E4DFB9|nr:fibronectin type III domain-containing protein [Geodermatophilus sp. YIM 151500]MCV2488358.1 fibronectin type III domain-containing protein [Geodermatophilus sp. YIM 151500]